MKIKGTVYLAGAITGLSYEEARLGWRAEYSDIIEDALLNNGQPLGDVGILSPMRGKDHISAYAGQEVITGHRASGYTEHVMSTGKGIVARDRWDTKRASVVVANLKDVAPGVVSIGTCVEFGWRDGNGPLIMIVPADDPKKAERGERQHDHDHLMLLEIADFIVYSVPEAAEVTLKLLKAGV
jgi:hypothetical protein